jgi:hypothetical protein
VTARASDLPFPNRFHPGASDPPRRDRRSRNSRNHAAFRESPLTDSNRRPPPYHHSRWRHEFAGGRDLLAESGIDVAVNLLWLAVTVGAAATGLPLRSAGALNQGESDSELHALEDAGLLLVDQVVAQCEPTLKLSVPEPFQRSPIDRVSRPWHPPIRRFAALFRVERTGIEPVTSGLQSRRSPS